MSVLSHLDNADKRFFQKTNIWIWTTTQMTGKSKDTLQHLCTEWVVYKAMRQCNNSKTVIEGQKSK